jgi:hypothetical protein
MSAFSQGRIGIVLPTWYRAYLVVAYRYLESKPLTPQEQKSLLERWDVDHPLPPPDTTQRAIALWMSARKHYLPSAPPKDIQEFKPNTAYYFEANCLAPAFISAAATLENRARRVGPASPELKEWVHGQDAVFSNCGGGVVDIPNELPAAASGWLRADRAYQVAAADFYSGHFADAVGRFQEIALDSSSPWQGLSTYLVARALVRQAAAQTTKPNQTYNPVLLAKAEVWLKNPTDDPKLEALHPDERALLDLVRYHLYPDQRQHELARMLADAGNGNRFGQYLRDYTMLLDRFLDTYPEFPGVDSWTPEYRERKQAWLLERYTDLKPQRGDDLSDWVMTMQWNAPAAKEHAVAKWRSTHTIPWLVVALGKLEADDTAPEGLINAAAEIPADSAAYATVAYQRARLAREAGDDQLARRVLQDALSLGKNLPDSAAHLLQDEQTTVAADFEDFQSRIWQTPILFDFGDGLPDTESRCYDAECGLTFYGVAKPPRSAHLLPQFSATAATLLNTQLPLKRLVELVQSSSLPENLRQRMAPAVWARAALLNDFESANGVAAAATAARPELRAYLADYRGAKTAQQRQFAAVFALLHFPGLRPFVDDSYPRTTGFGKIDNYRDNWWCGDVGGVADQVNYSKPYLESAGEIRELSPPVSSLAFLDSSDKLRATAEWQQLRLTGFAGRYLPRIVIDWASRNPEDPRVPEALHLAVRATRYGCSDGKPNKLSRQAYTTLHKNYPHSEWAKRTPFWF